MKKIVLILLLMTAPVLAIDRVGASDTLKLSDYITAFYTYLGSSSTPYTIVDTASVRKVVNESLRAISEEKADAVPRRDTLVTTSGVNLYALNIDAIGVTAVLAKSTKWNGIDSVDFSNIGFKVSDRDATPRQWATRGDGYLWLEPVNNTGDSLMVFYQARANYLSADTVVSNVRGKYFDTAIQMTVTKLLGIK